jgi:hypothetical protein
MVNFSPSTHTFRPAVLLISFRSDPSHIAYVRLTILNATEPEKVRVAALDLRAGRRAKASAAYASAPVCADMNQALASEGQFPRSRSRCERLSN